ncbi:MAG: response regulator transcription factor [Beijerinckiaceae bacterium]
MSSDSNTLVSSAPKHGEDSIIAIDSRALERGCMARVLRSEFADHQILEAESTVALTEVSCGNPRLVVLRIHPGQQSDETIARDVESIRRIWPSAQIALVCDDDERSLQYALSHRCSGFLPTSLPLEIAVAALRLVLVGGLYFPQTFVTPEPVEKIPHAVETVSAAQTIPLEPAAARQNGTVAPIVLNGCNGAPIVADPTATAPSFTPREIEVVEALRRGRSNKVIASDLNLSENTVKVHVRHIMRKLRATNRTQAALRSQLLFDPAHSFS